MQLNLTKTPQGGDELNERGARSGAEAAGARPSGAAATPGSAGTPGAAATAAPPTGRLGPRPWWERFPGRLDYELDELSKAGIKHQLDQEAFRRGLVRIAISWPTAGGDIDLVAVYPDYYPYFRPEVVAANLDLGRHQNPVTHQLCLIGRATINWREQATLYTHISERLPKVLEATSADIAADQLADLEEHQGEPASNYLPHLPAGHFLSPTLLVDGSWNIPSEVPGGTLKLGCDPGRTSAIGLYGAVLEVRSDEGEVLGCLRGRNLGSFPVIVYAQWVRLRAAPLAATPPEVLRLLRQTASGLGQQSYQCVGSARLRVSAALFDEEVRWRESGTAWVFVVEQKTA